MDVDPMLKHLISFSLKQSTLVILIAAGLLIYTLARLPKMSVLEPLRMSSQATNN